MNGTDIKWIPAQDESKVQRIGAWQETSFRYAAKYHLFTSEDGAALEFAFDGTSIAIRLGAHGVPAYAAPNSGSLLITIDGKEQQPIHPLASPREIVLARNLPKGSHILRIEHRANGKNSGCRIEGLRVLEKALGDLQFNLSGEENAFLVDARVILRKNGKIIRDTLLRNCRTGQCSLVGLMPGKGYSLEVNAIGWKSIKVDHIAIKASKPSTIPPLFLIRDEATVTSGVRFPALNRPAIHTPGQSFRARFMGYHVSIDKVVLRREFGPAIISRSIEFEEDESAGYYYDREIIARLPADMPAGAYDLFIHVSDKNSKKSRGGIRQSTRSVHIVSEFPRDPVLVTFGHLDTAGQYQAEYLKRVVSMANLIAPDLVLDSTAVNPAYISGALSGLYMPYLINFGNHQFFGHEKWYGNPVHLIDFGPDISILNFGRPWHEAQSKSKADLLLNSRPNRRYKIIHCFESNAGIDWLNRHRICLIHDAHGIGEKNHDIGTTPTRRVGKTNAVSFRVVRLENGKVKSSSYNGHKSKPIPFQRDEEPPLRLTYSQKNSGTHREISATVTNDYLEDYPQCRVKFVLPNGQYKVDRGKIESSILSDDKQFVVLSVRVDVPAEKSITLNVQAK